MVKMVKGTDFNKDSLDQKLSSNSAFHLETWYWLSDLHHIHSIAYKQSPLKQRRLL